jgi:predicted  nucleic acid-binding Zn-ribbon protein
VEAAVEAAAAVVVVIAAPASRAGAAAGPARRMTDPAHALLALQETDSALDRVAHRRQTLPERRALADAEVRATAVADELAAAERRAEELATEIRRREDEVAANEARAASLEQSLDSGSGSPRDLAAMADEVSGIRRRIRVLEDALLDLLEEAETVGGTQADLRLVRDERHVEVARASALLQEVEAELAAEEAGLRPAREAQAGDVTPELLATYERLRARLGGVAVAPLEGGRCGGCHLTLPATELDALRHAPPDALVRHEECGRILVRPAT